MSILDRYKSTTPPQSKRERYQGNGEELGRSFTDLVEAKVSEIVGEIQAKADAQVAEAVARASKAEEAAASKYTAPLAAAEARSRDAEAAVLLHATARASAEGMLVAERGLRAETEERLRVEVAALDALRKEIAARPAVVAPVPDGAMQRLEAKVDALRGAKPAARAGELEVKVFKDGMGAITKFHITPRD